MIFLNIYYTGTAEEMTFEIEKIKKKCKSDQL